MFRLVRAEVGSASEAEDLVQETFLRAWIALPGFRFEARFFTWLYRIMLNTVRQHQRTSARRRALDARRPTILKYGMPADAPSEGEETQARIWQALAGISEEYRTAFLLREWEGQTYAEIAETMACAAGTVASRIARARQMLAERLGAE